MLNGYPGAVAEQFRHFFRRPGEVPAIVALNAVMVTAAWFLLPAWVQAWLFSLHGPLAFPIVLAAWMIADTPATNVLGDHGVDTAVLTDRESTRSWVVGRSLALGGLVGVPCVVVALLVGAVDGHWPVVVLTCVAIVLAPVGILPVAACLGLLLPYRPQPLRHRWSNRRAWPTQLRWLLLVLAPYVVVPLIGTALVSPAVAVELAVAGRSRSLRPSDIALVAPTLAATMLAAGAAGLWCVERIVDRRRTQLQAFLARPYAG